MMKIYFYLAVLLVLGSLFFLSANEKPFSEKKLSGLELLFRKAAVWLYRNYRGSKRRRKKAGRIFPAEEIVRADMNLLDPSGKGKQRETLYYIGKIQNFLLFLAAADVLALAVTLSSRQNQKISALGTIDRPGYGQENLELQGIAYAQNLPGSRGEPVGEYTIEVGAREYTKEETDRMAENLVKALPKIISGKNRSLSHVTNDLDLVTEVAGYPFRIRWESSSYEYIDSDGTVGNAMLADGTNQIVTLTAVLSYLDRKYKADVDVTLLPKKKTESEKLTDDIEAALFTSNEVTATGAEYYLPEHVNGVKLLWSEPEQDNGLAVFLLVVAAGVAVFFLRDRELHRRTQEREQQMALDYPQIVSKMALLLGAGMSVFHSFQRMADDYRDECRKGGEAHYVYEEILLMCREIENGVSESTALGHFGRRCRSQRYTKFASMLAQSRQKGNDRLLQSLREEADLAGTDRRNLARQLGEEAGTKLLLPMIMMLAVTLVMIIVPAYYGFSL